MRATTIGIALSCALAASAVGAAGRVRVPAADPVAASVAPLPAVPDARAAAMTAVPCAPADETSGAEAVAMAPCAPADETSGAEAVATAPCAPADASVKVKAVATAFRGMSPAQIVAYVARALPRVGAKAGADIRVAAMLAAAEAGAARAPAWYDMRLFDAMTSLWALAERARWYAERGDEDEVRRLYAIFVKTVADNPEE